MAVRISSGIEVRHHGVDRQPILGRRLDDAHIADAQQRHVQRARNRRGAHGEHVHVLAHLLQPFLVAHAEALLFVDDQQPEIAELDVFRKQPVRADGDVDFAGGQFLERRLHFLGATGSARTFRCAPGNAAKRALERLVMLEREHRGGRQHGHLFAVAQRLEGGAHGDFGFAVADVAAQQPVHGMRRFHVALDFLHGGELVLGLGELEGVFEFALPVGIARKGEALGHAALRVELQQLVRHVAHFGFDARLARPSTWTRPAGRAEAPLRPRRDISRPDPCA